ncbi:MAG: hypothetical protein E4H09_00560 [Spirochaetales bacterium]|nr:MAG: hypothetical protein E4H09_00560 [Spirochaetales bacterium]
MKINWRVSIIAAGGAFLLSLLVGLIGGVGFGAIVLRALIGGIVFGLGASGVGVAIERFIPELNSALHVDATNEKSGTRVDIVVEDDPMDPDSGSEGMPDEAEHEAGTFSPGFGEDTLDDDNDVIEELEETDSEISNSGDSEEYAGASGDAENSGLPDMDGLSDSFGDAPAGEVRDIDDTERSGEDPTLMVRAIRTILKRGE